MVLGRVKELAGLASGTGFSNPYEGRAELMRRYPVEPLLAGLAGFVEQAKHALGPSLIRVRAQLRWSRAVAISMGACRIENGAGVLGRRGVSWASVE